MSYLYINLLMAPVQLMLLIPSVLPTIMTHTIQEETLAFSFGLYLDLI